MEDQAMETAVLDKLTKICLCKAISRATIKKAIANKADTVEKVQQATGAGYLRSHIGQLVRIRKSEDQTMIHDHDSAVFTWTI